jgi:hypothetical protein
VTTELHIVCQLCPAPSTCVFELFNAGKTLAVRCCAACGEKLQDEMNALHAALSELQRAGMDERMAQRVLAQKVARKDLCPSIPFSDELPVIA